MIYLVLQLLKRLIKPTMQNPEIHEKFQKRDPIDLSEADVEDAEFEEIKDK